MESGYRLLVGLDWATQAHQVCVLDRQGRLLEQRRVEHRAEAIAAMIDRLIGLAGGDPASIAVAIEVPRGAVVEALVERGLHVFAINPKQLDRFRDRHTVAGAKDDRRDAFVAADALRTDRGAFRQLRPDDPHLIQLRDMSRLHEELGREVSRLTNRLREQLLRFYPQGLTLCPAADEPWLWSLLDRAPTPAQARGLRLSTLRALLADHHIRRFSADELHAALQASALPVAPGTCEAAREHLALLLPRLRLVHEQRRHCERRLEQLLTALAAEPVAERREHRDVTILRSLPGVGRVVAATMLAEAAQPLAARDYQTLRAHGGIAPVTRKSGKTLSVSMRYGCNRRLRNAFYH